MHEMNGSFVIYELSSLAAQVVVIITASGAASYENFIKITILQNFILQLTHVTHVRYELGPLVP